MACCTGEVHTVCLSDEGNIYSFGGGPTGRAQLGIGNQSDTSLPNQITDFYINNQIYPLPAIKQVSCGAYFTVCIDYEGSLYSFGENHAGQLGLGNKNEYKFPQKVQDIPPISSISCGVFHTLAITHEGDLWSFGKNERGELCLGNTEEQLTPQKTSYSSIVKISAGYHSLFQNDLGEFFGCGRSDYLPLRHVDVCIIKSPPNIIQFCCGYHHSLFLDSEGNVFSIGYNLSGNLGIGNYSNQKTFNKILNIPPIETISCIGHSSYLLDFDGNLWCFGFNFMSGSLTKRNIPTKHPGLNCISQIASGCCGNHFLCKNFEHKIFVDGTNYNGQLGLGDGKMIPNYKEMNSDYFSIWGNTQSIRNRVKSARK